MSFSSFLKSLNPFRAFGPRVPEIPAPKVDTNENRLTNILLSAQLAAAQRRQRQLEEAARPPEQPRSALDGFLYFGEWLPVKSSNVAAIRYDPDQSRLEVEFKDKGTGPGFYAYDDISIREAEQFANASSPGGWVWDHLRVRGKGNFWAYRKPYQLLSFSPYQPQWMRSGRTRWLHGTIKPEGLKYRSEAQQKRLSKRLMPRNTKT